MTLGSHRAALLAIVLLGTSILGIAVGLWYPDPANGDHYTYAQISPMRTEWWIWQTIAGTNLVLGVCATAVACWLLVKTRGAVWGTVGGCLLWLGAGLYAVGIGGLATFFYFGTEPAAVDAASGERMVEYAQDHIARLWGPLIAGAVLVALGTVVLAIALWLARSVPRWVPVLLATAPVTFVATTGVAGTLAGLPLTVGTVALGWYVWRDSSRPAELGSSAAA
jgi:hypothetical protein